MHLPHFLEPVSEGLYAIDTGFHRERFDAAYLLVDAGRAAFIDTGTNFAVPRLLQSLQAVGLGPASVDWVIPTHVHLDHAGGCGLLMQALPTAQLLVHPRGARHLIDPSALYEGARAVYGQEEMDTSYGQLQPIRAERVQTTSDGQWITLGSRRLQFMDAPGHARHHHVVWDERSQGWFTGDTFGLSYREFDVDGRAWIIPSSTPVQFEPEALKASITRMAARQPQRMYLTHYSAVSDVPRLAQALLEQIDEMVGLARNCEAGSQRHQALKLGLTLHYTRRARAHGCALDDHAIAQALAVDIELNAQGLAIWLDKTAAPATSAKVLP